MKIPDTRITPEINSSPGETPPEQTQRWYVIKTKPREEELCLEQLSSKGMTVFCPMTKEFRWRRRQTEIVPLFPGYIFCRFTYPDHYYDVKWERGVSKLVRFGENDPPYVSDAAVEMIRSIMDEDGTIDQTSEFKPGDSVRFRTGPFKDLVGTILRADTAQERIVVLMELLYQAKVEVESYHVEAV